jgi:hypothetical protein
MRLYIFFTIAGFLLNCTTSNKENVENYDVCVYGGTSAGVIAAISVAKSGKSVILVEPGMHVGGLTSGGLGYTDIGNKFAITGLSREFYRRIGEHYGKFEQWIFEPGVAEGIFMQLIFTYNINLLNEYRLTEVIKNKEYISNIVVENYSGSPKIKKTIAAKMFIDCSYEGDLMAKAGVSYMVGRESNSTYNETYNGVQLLDQHQFPDGVDPYKVPGDPSSGLLWGISDAKPEPNGSGDKKVQAYNFRICLSNDPGNIIPITRPEDYDSTWYELLVRLFKAQPDKIKLNDYCIVSSMPNHKTDINNRGGFSTDMIGMNYGYPEGSYEERAEILKNHVTYTKGWLYFLGHDPRVPEELRNEMKQWGYPKDEYTDNGNWSPQPYIRECRRMIGSYVMTQANCQGKETVNDGIGMAAYTMDSHNCQRIVVNGMVKNEGDVQVGGFGPYPISYRSIIPKQAECGNLLVPVCLSASHIAYGSIRMEPVFMVLAQSAAVAACMAIDNGQPVQEVDVKKVQEILIQNPLLDGSLPEILVDNDDSLRVSITGNWVKEIYGGYGPSYLISDRSSELKSVQFNPVITVSGNYSVYTYIPKISNTVRKTRYVINDGTRFHETSIDSDVQVEGQTSGEWVSLGAFELDTESQPSITISNKDADGSVVADAILLVKSEE